MPAPLASPKGASAGNLTQHAGVGVIEA